MGTISRWIDSHITLHEHESPREERANSYTHLLGGILAVPGTIILIIRGIAGGSAAQTAGFAVFGFTMILLFSASGLYHLVRPSTAKRMLRVLDHSNIYLLIAGTYTPVLVALNSGLGRAFLWLIWGIATFGIIFTLIFWGRYGFLHVFLYLAMGWLVVVIWDDVTAAVPHNMLWSIAAGGVTYTVGVIFYALKRLPYGHAVWHLFVLGGCGCFYYGILTYLAAA